MSITASVYTTLAFRILSEIKRSRVVYYSEMSRIFAKQFGDFLSLDEFFVHRRAVRIKLQSRLCREVAIVEIRLIFNFKIALLVRK